MLKTWACPEKPPPGWQLGTRPDTDPEVQAVRDDRDATLILRTEVTALVGLLTEKGVFTVEEYGRQVAEEANHLSKEYERRFPGAKATDEGMQIDMERARSWFSQFPP